MRICIFRKVAWYTRAVDLAQFYRKNARGTQKNKGTASIFAWFCTRSRGHGQQRGPTETSGRRPRRKRCRFAKNPVQYLLVEGTALGEYASQALKGSDAAQPTGCSASLVPCVANETIDPLTTGVIYLYMVSEWAMLKHSLLQLIREMVLPSRGFWSKLGLNNKKSAS